VTKKGISKGGFGVGLLGKEKKERGRGKGGHEERGRK
jgi:hypothetical protein